MLSCTSPRTVYQSHVNSHHQNYVVFRHRFEKAICSNLDLSYQSVVFQQTIKWILSCRPILSAISRNAESIKKGIQPIVNIASMLRMLHHKGSLVGSTQKQYV